MAFLRDDFQLETGSRIHNVHHHKGFTRSVRRIVYVNTNPVIELIRRRIADLIGLLRQYLVSVTLNTRQVFSGLCNHLAL